MKGLHGARHQQAPMGDCANGQLRRRRAVVVINCKGGGGVDHTNVKLPARAARGVDAGVCRLSAAPAVAAGSAVCVVISSYSLRQRPPSAVMWAVARRRPAARAHAALELALLAPLAPLPLPPSPPPPLRVSISYTYFASSWVRHSRPFSSRRVA